MKRYELYDYSGFDWLGETPSHWKVLRMCYMFKPVSIKNTSGEMNLSVYRDYGVIPTDSRDDNHNVISEDTSNYKLVEEGDFVMNKMKCWMGSLGLSDYRGIVSPSYTVMKPLQSNNHKFTHYLLRSKTYIPQYKRLSYGVREGQWDLRFEDFRELPCCIPPLSEQQQIVSFLDTKTSLIDSLIEKTQRKIQLLKEKRTSLISEVVTKGLNPDVEMKYSGVEWIGEIPKEWGCGDMKYQLSNNDGGVWGKDVENEYEGTIVIRSTEITIDGNWDLSNPMKRLLSNSEIMKSLLYENDIVLTKSSGSPEHIGKSVIVTKEVEELKCCYSNFVQRLRFRTYNSKLYHYILNSYVVREQYRYLTQSTTGLGNLSGSTLNEVKLPFIPISEQQQIVEYLDEQTQLIDKTISIEEKRIELLKEYRQSLISEVVTGKRKVVELRVPFLLKQDTRRK